MKLNDAPASRGLGIFGWRYGLRAGFGALRAECPSWQLSALGQTPDPVQFVVAFNRDVSGATGLDGNRPRRTQATLRRPGGQGPRSRTSSASTCSGAWTNAAPIDRQAFRQEFRNYLIQTFAAKVTGLGDGRMTVTSVVQGDSSILVLTEITDKLPARELFAWRLGAHGRRVASVRAWSSTASGDDRHHPIPVRLCPREGVSDFRSSRSSAA